MVRFSIACALALTAQFGFARHCQNLTIPVTISAQNSIWNINAPSNNVEVINFVLDVNRQGHTYAQDVFGGVYMRAQIFKLRCADVYNSIPLSVVSTISEQPIVRRITDMVVPSKFSPMEVDLTERKMIIQHLFETQSDLDFELLGSTI